MRVSLLSHCGLGTTCCGSSAGRLSQGDQQVCSVEEHTATRGALARGGEAGRLQVGGTSVASVAVRKRQYLACHCPGTVAAAF